ncbi:MAG: phosphatidylglycerophosphatase A [Calditrichia bacterium]
MRIINYILATGLGTGFSPVAPGTAGSILAVLVLYFVPPFSPWLLLAILFVLFWIGVYTGGELEKELGEDPSIVVIDEVVGMGISLLFIPHDWRLFLIAFALFRLFDILKPPPVDQSQQLPGGLGIMIDDVLAGIYALAGVHILRWLFF